MEMNPAVCRQPGLKTAGRSHPGHGANKGQVRPHRKTMQGDSRRSSPYWSVSCSSLVTVAPLNRLVHWEDSCAHLSRVPFSACFHLPDRCGHKVTERSDGRRPVHTPKIEPRHRQCYTRQGRVILSLGSPTNVLTGTKNYTHTHLADASSHREPAHDPASCPTIWSVAAVEAKRWHAPTCAPCTHTFLVDWGQVPWSVTRLGGGGSGLILLSAAEDHLYACVAS